MSFDLSFDFDFKLVAILKTSEAVHETTLKNHGREFPKVEFWEYSFASGDIGRWKTFHASGTSVDTETCDGACLSFYRTPSSQK